ncbi:hypothetical protein LZC95_02145 [Pendulispora brunnea]|uniref:Uncharacterized protein n=1 Tax=Pendulispora brunnea TaxID=2905690 RepID=A0ABZ2KAD5_9BACT
MFEYEQSRLGLGVFVATLKGNGTEAALALRRSGETTSDVVENTFKDDDKAHRVLGRIAADLKTQSPRSGSGAQASATSESDLHVTGGPLTQEDGGGLTQDAGPLTTGCVVLLPSAGQGASTANQCSLFPTGSPCQTPQETDTSSQCASDGVPVCPPNTEFVQTSRTVLDSTVPGLPTGAVICTRIDHVAYKQRGDVAGNPYCNATQDNVTYGNTTAGTTMVSKKITITATNTTTEKEATTIGGEAGLELKAVKLSLNASKMWGTEDSKAVATAVENWESYTVTNSESRNFTIRPGYEGKLFVTNDIVDYTQISFIRNSGSSSWQKGEGTGRVKVPRTFVAETTPVSSCAN